MIRLFGKIRYHWQPELSWAIIYWSMAFTPVLIGLSLLYERAKVSLVILGLFVIFVVLFGSGLHRYFLLEDGFLKISSANPFTNYKIPLSSVHKIEVDYLSVRIIADDFPQGRIYYMRKWPKKYFVNDLARDVHFQGEVELMDHLIRLDYFETYYSSRDV